MFETGDDGSFAPLADESFGRASVTAGGDLWWNRLNVVIWSALADPEGQTALPSLSSMVARRTPPAIPSRDEFAPIWVGAMQLVLYSLGWASPAHGFLEWRDRPIPKYQ